MSIPRIIAELCGNVWAYEPYKLETIASVLLGKHEHGSVTLNPETREQMEAREATMWEGLAASCATALDVAGVSGAEGGVAMSAAGDRVRIERTEYGARIGSVAVISVSGMIAKSASMVNGASQPRGTSLDLVRSARAAAARDPDAKSRLYLVDSGGGYADGMAEIGDELFSGRALGATPDGKPEWAYISGLGASAAYWFASQTERVETGADGVVGSIGTYMVVYDQSKQVEDEGAKVHLIRSPDSERSVKGVGVPGTKITERAKANWQRGVDGYQSFFTAAVARGRGMPAEKVAELATGETWMGAEAKRRGLVDAVRPVGATIAEMNRKYGGRGEGTQDFKSEISNVKEESGRVAVTGADVAMASASMDPALEGGATQTVAESAQTDGKDPMRMLGLMTGLLLAPGAATAGNESGGGGGGGGGAATIDQAEFDRRVDAGVAAKVAAEKARIAAIKSEAEPFAHVAGVADLVIKASKPLDEGGMKVEDFKTQLMKTVAEGTKPTGIVSAAGLSLGVGTSGSERWVAAVSDGLFARANPTMVMKMEQGGPDADRMARAMGYENAAKATAAVRASRESGFAQMRLGDIASQYLVARGQNPWALGGADGIFAATFGQGTGDFANILANTARKSLEAAFAEAPATWNQWCSVGSASDFKSTSRVSLSEAPNLKQITEGGSLDGGLFKDRGFTVAVDTYGRVFGLSRKAYINDDVGAFARYPALIGAAAARLPEDLAYAKLVANPTLADSVALFHGTHRNLESASALAMSTLFSAITKMRSQIGFGEDAAPLDIQPSVILTGLALAGTAKELFENKNDPTAANNNGARTNQVAGQCRPIASPRITSTTAFYVIANPSQAPVIELTFLNGNQRPQIVPKPMQSIADGPQWEVMFDVAASAVGFEGGVYNPGA